MTDDPSKVKWHTIDPATALALTNQTEKPGLVYSIGSNALPYQLQNVQGLVTFYVSSYGQPISLTPGMAAGGEIAVVRHDQGIGKAYNYIFGTSSNGLVCFSGPYKDFPAHHFATTTPVPVESLFGHPFTKGKT